MKSQLIYEEVHEKISKIPVAETHTSRTTYWLDSQKTFGVSRDTSGVVELFIFGNQLFPSLDVVKRNTDFSPWALDGENPRNANRVKLPKEIYFEAFAAFLCLHFVENGIFLDQEKSFKLSEPLIALAYEKNSESVQAQIGCIGELVFLRSLLSVSTKYNEVLQGWQGFEKSLRDFQYGTTGIEVKVNTTSSSRHHIQGVHQVEPGIISNNQVEKDFYLLSIGLIATSEDAENSFTLPELVQTCIDQISDIGAESQLAVEILIEKVEKYLGGFGIPYRHLDAKNHATYSRRWQVSFTRAYDMSDSNISLLNTAKLADISMVLSDSVQFDINLPLQVTGDLNPIVGMHNFVQKVLPAI